MFSVLAVHYVYAINHDFIMKSELIQITIVLVVCLAIQGMTSFHSTMFFPRNIILACVLNSKNTLLLLLFVIHNTIA